MSEHEREEQQHVPAGAVARVDSFTNASYSRNYRLTWLRDVPAGTLLYAGSAPGADAGEGKTSPPASDAIEAGRWRWVLDYPYHFAGILKQYAGKPREREAIVAVVDSDMQRLPPKTQAAGPCDARRDEYNALVEAVGALLDATEDGDTQEVGGEPLERARGKAERLLVNLGARSAQGSAPTGF